MAGRVSEKPQILTIDDIDIVYIVDQSEQLLDDRSKHATILQLKDHILASISGAGTDIHLTSGLVNGNDLILTLSDNSLITVDVTTLLGGGNVDTMVSGGLVDNNNLVLILSDNSTVTIDVSTLIGGAGGDVKLISGSVNGNNLVLNLSDNSTVIVDVSSLVGGSGNPLVQDLTNPNSTDILSTQGILNAINAIGGSGSTDDEKWIPNHAYAAFETFTITPTQSTPIDKDGNILETGEVYSVYYDIATTSSATLVLTEIAKLSVVKDINENSFKTRAFTNGTMLFNGNVIYDDIHVQSGVEAFSLVNSIDNVPGAVHYLKFTSNGSNISSTSEFNDFGKGVFLYMQNNPSTYELKFEYVKTDNIEEIWVTARRAELATTGNPTGQFQGSFNEGDTLPDPVVNSGDFIYLIKLNGDFWTQVSNGISWIDDVQITDPTAITALTVANNAQVQVNLISDQITPDILPFNPIMDFNKSVTYEDVYVQNSPLTFSESTAGKDAATHVGYITTSGANITFPSNFKEITKDMISFMVNFPNTYRIMFLKVKTPLIDEVWMTAPEAATTSGTTPQVATDVTLTSNTIAENNAINQEVGILGSDALPAATSYILSGTDAADFNIFDSGGGVFKLRASSVFDFETKTIYLIDISAVNSAGTLTPPKSFSINITDVAEGSQTVPDPVWKTFVRPSDTALNNDLHIQWEVPASDGGSPIIGYKIERSLSLGGAWSVIVSNTGNTNLTYVDSNLGQGIYALYRVYAINAIGEGFAFGIGSAITLPVPVVSGFVFSENFNGQTINASPSTFTELLGNTTVEDISTGSILGMSWDSKTGGSYSSNPWDSAQSKFSGFADTNTDYTVICHMMFGSTSAKAGIFVRSTSTGSFTEGYFLQFDNVNNQIKLWSIHSGGQFDQITTATTPLNADIITRQLVRIDIVGNLLTCYFRNMVTPVITHTFTQNLHANGGVVISAGWDSTNESNIIFDNLYISNL